jgi:diaminohydroxyphosphoribosylaminopyrimidine deaminase / 5-amino-6-(5-phosphoribosylamino)uracil reductase
MKANEADRQRLMQAIELAKKCPPSSTAFSVGAIIVDEHGEMIADGYSRDIDERVHAEESALSRLHGVRLDDATLYSTLEPCSIRRSRPLTCTQLIIAAGIRRVVIAWREPDLFVADCQGVELLTSHGIEVVEISDLSEPARKAGMPSDTGDSLESISEPSPGR